MPPQIANLRAAAPANTVQTNLGPLAELPGTWTGKGFNIISLPDFHDGKKFRLMMNATQETLTFTPIGAPIPNRGNTQDDIFFLGLQYLQQVSDAVTSEGLHVEPGLWLNLPANPVQTAPTVVRMASVPHGDSLLAQGQYTTITTAPDFGVADSIPFTLDASGKRVPDPNRTTYLAPYFNSTPPPGIPNDAILNPNVVLQQAFQQQVAAGRKPGKTIVMRVDATPVGGINGTPVEPTPVDVGGIVNIPFVTKNANANAMSAIFWIEQFQNQDGSWFVQLQYSQTVILDFPVPDATGKIVDIKWPHISVATLIKR